MRQDGCGLRRQHVGAHLAGQDDAEEHERPAPELTGRQRLAQQHDGENDADQRIQVAEGGGVARLEVSEAVPAEDEGQGRAASPQVEEQQPVSQRQRPDLDGCQLDEGSGQQEQQPVAGAAGHDCQGAAAEGPPTEDDVGGDAGFADQGEKVTEGRCAGGRARPQQHDGRHARQGDEQPGQAPAAQSFPQNRHREQRGQDRDGAVEHGGSGGVGEAEADVLASAEEGHPGQAQQGRGAAGRRPAPAPVNQGQQHEVGERDAQAGQRQWGNVDQGHFAGRGRAAPEDVGADEGENGQDAGRWARGQRLGESGEGQSEFLHRRQPPRRCRTLMSDQSASRSHAP
ncbi:MAG: hypothetical protein M3R02_26870 [Chloroflexota bacterium]|nr:hypothetical protein [Chloroflexota bacterium]